MSGEIPMRSAYGSELNVGDTVYLKCTISERQHQYGNMVRLETSDSAIYANKNDILTAHDIVWAVDEDDGK